MATTLLLSPGAEPAALQRELQRLGVWAALVRDDHGDVRALELAAHSAAVSPDTLRGLPGVAAVLAAASGHPRLDRTAFTPQLLGRTAKGGEVWIGGGEAPLLCAGPCSAESEETAWTSAALAAAAGARLLRGGAFKPRTSPYAFAGEGEPALRWLADAAHAHGLLLVSEAMSEAHAEAVAASADVIQVGSRSMAAYGLLGAIGRLGKPVLLKRGRAATLDEWRLAAEHVLAAGAPSVVLCERGIVGPDSETRNVLDLGAVALLAGIDGLAVMVDPSHAVGRRDLVLPMAKAALAAGAHGLLVEVHPDAGLARSDGPQALAPQDLARLGTWMKAQRPLPLEAHA